MGIMIDVIGAANGPLTGYAMNPACDFSTHLFIYKSSRLPPLKHPTDRFSCTFNPIGCIAAPILNVVYRITSLLQRFTCQFCAEIIGRF
ncbi:aquaporin [Vibrio sp. NFV-1]|uniref:Aquaporin n=1 Tax=Vibrio nitrifigilis TaxID=2789781 RepID=A0ABS0GJH4_9VIBR|nr:aquaporin [Vibrio nitrifigilis]